MGTPARSLDVARVVRESQSAFWEWLRKRSCDRQVRMQRVRRGPGGDACQLWLLLLVLGAHSAVRSAPGAHCRRHLLLLVVRQGERMLGHLHGVLLCSQRLL